MKKLLILLLCIPFIGFAQDDCGTKPKYKGNKFGNKYKNSKEYKKFKKDLDQWEKCNEEKYGSLENDAYYYLDNNKLDPIEGIWTFMFKSGSLVSKVFIKKNGNHYEEIILESYNSFYSGGKRGSICCKVTDYASSGIYTFKSRSGGSQIVTMKNNNLFETSYGYLGVRNYPKEGERKKSRNGEWAGNGSGVIISKSGHIITNNHVIDDADDIEVEFILDSEVQKFNAEIVQVDKTNDLAVIKIVDVNFDGVDNLPYNFKTRSSDVGTKVYAYGYPMALTIMGKEIKVTDGIISSKTGFDGNITTYQITAPIQGGNSGGPLFDDKGNLIGINQAKIRNDVADNVSYSIKTSYVLNLIDILPKSIDLPSSNKLANLPLTEQIKQLTKYVVLVKVK